MTFADSFLVWDATGEKFRLSPEFAFFAAVVIAVLLAIAWRRS